MARAVGIGGVFLEFKGDQEELQTWYQENLDLDMTAYGTGFTEGRQLVILSFKRNNENSPYINLRVDDIDSLFIEFKSQGLKIVNDIKEYEYGKFGQFEDPFGNIIELWEPYLDNYLKMVEKEIEEYKKSKL